MLSKAASRTASTRILPLNRVANPFSRFALPSASITTTTTTTTTPTTSTSSKISLLDSVDTHKNFHFYAQHGRAPRVLVTGSLGQLGTGLVQLMRSKYGADNVIATDIKRPTREFWSTGPFMYADVLDYKGLEQIVVDNGIDWVVHLSAVLSAVGEKNPQLALNINLNGFQNVLDLAKTHQLRLLSPSTIGAFGPSTPKDSTPDTTIMRPNTIYGITKLHMELMGEYYHQKHGVDFRSLRYPGIISADTQPGGGTTDYAVEIFHSALRDNHYTSFLGPDSELPMMYITDCLRGTVELLEHPGDTLTQRVYNLDACSFSPAQLAEEIRRQHSEDFSIGYSEPDFRQAIADSWPRSIDGSQAKVDWGWNPVYDDTSKLVAEMFKQLKPLFARQTKQQPQEHEEHRHEYRPQQAVLA
ncbi:hypothetical protein H4219_006042 [Mycoemilia scoparia]|uniref:L-threonine 3-dehydrogenase, mitochondrial n=1 Tax=Mycoemilia scoparia TaxID=417184 RepID=A0A9W7ZLH2_9FUNG|nr:hypothetical protein H4219_006042 [Mycoemilia scoparia]